VVKEGGTTFTSSPTGSRAPRTGRRPRPATGRRAWRWRVGAQQYLRAGLLDELHIHVAPILLGGGVSLFGELGTAAPPLKLTQVVESPFVTHLSYEVER
jgi:hypothetical protein